MEQQNNAVATVTEQNKVTKELCIQFLKSQHTDLTQGEFEMFAAVAIAFNLNPYLKEIYPIKYSGKMNLITGYQTYIKRAETFPQFDGYDTEFEGEGKNLCCVCNVYRKDRSRPTTARVYFSEYTQNNTMWNTKPHVMLEKVAIGTAFRRAFPTDMGGMPYTTEEIRAEDELKAQGLTEAVPSEAEARTLTPFQAFSARLKEMNAEDDEAFALVKEEMKKEGWLKPSDVPESQYNRVEAWFSKAKAQMIMEQEAENGNE